MNSLDIVPTLTHQLSTFEKTNISEQSSDLDPPPLPSLGHVPTHTVTILVHKLITKTKLKLSKYLTPLTT